MALFGNLGLLFEKNTPVLRFNYGKDPNVRWVLWPVFVWRVVAPIPKERKLNLFQRAVLGLARAKITSPVDVASRLLIKPELAELVLLELQNMALINYAIEPTILGLKMLADIEEEPTDELQVGHVFSDALSGKLWPRFLTGDLPITDVEPGDDGWPVLLSGSAGDPWKDRAFTVLPTERDKLLMDRPSAFDVLRAARRHRRQRDYNEVDDDRDVPHLKRVSFVDEHPRPYLLALRVRRHASGDWMVDDPFSHTESTELRACLEERLGRNQRLRAWLSPIMGSDATTPTLGPLQAESRWMVEERLGLAVRQYEAMWERLVAMQRALLEAESPDAPPDKWDDVLVKAQRAMESVLYTVYRKHHKINLFLFKKLADSDKNFNRHLLDAIATELGFNTPLPITLSLVHRGKVQNAEQGGKDSLRPLIVLGLIYADHDEGHPFRQAGRSKPDLLHRLDALATDRNKAAHDGVTTRPQKVPQHVDAVYAAVEVLFYHH